MIPAFFSPVSTSLKNSRSAQKAGRSSRNLSVTFVRITQRFTYSINVFKACQCQIRNIPRVHTGTRTDGQNSLWTHATGKIGPPHWSPSVVIGYVHKCHIFKEQHVPNNNNHIIQWIHLRFLKKIPGNNPTASLCISVCVFVCVCVLSLVMVFRK